MVRNYGRAVLDVNIMDFDTNTLNAMIQSYQARKLMTGGKALILVLGTTIRFLCESVAEAKFITEYFDGEIAEQTPGFN